MFFTHLFRHFFRRAPRQPKQDKGRRRSVSPRWPGLEMLEDRTLLSGGPEGLPLPALMLIEGGSRDHTGSNVVGLSLAADNTVANVDVGSPITQLPIDPDMVLTQPFDQKTGQLVYLDFDGAADVSYRGPVQHHGLSIPAFSAASAGLDGATPQIAAITVNLLNQSFAEFNVHFTTVQPSAGLTYSTVYIGGSNATFSDFGAFLGVAENVDIGNANHSDNALVFSDTIATVSTNAIAYLDTLTTAIGHETGHLLGFRHQQHSFSGGGLLDEVGYSQEAHRWFAERAFDLFWREFGQSAIYAQLSPFLQGAFDEDAINTTPFIDETTDSSHPSSKHFWEHALDYSRKFEDGVSFVILGKAFDADSAPDRAMKYITGGIGWRSAAGGSGGPDVLYVDPLWKGDGALHLAQQFPGLAYNYLGHVAHLLQDMSVPAHAHGDPHLDKIPWTPINVQIDPDPYHDWVDSLTFSTSVFQNPLRISSFDDPATNGKGELRYQVYAPGGVSAIDLVDLRSPKQLDAHFLGYGNSPGPLYRLFLEIADDAARYDTPDYVGSASPVKRLDDQTATQKGNVWEDRLSYGSFERFELELMATDLVPRAVRGTAELIRYFYGIQDTAKPAVEITSLTGRDIAHPQIVSNLDDLVVLTVASTDQDTGNSGVGRRLFHFQYQVQQQDGSWSEWIENPSIPENGKVYEDLSTIPGTSPALNGKHGASFSGSFRGEDGKLYRFRASAEDGAGNVGTSDYFYVKIVHPRPTLDFSSGQRDAFLSGLQTFVGWFGKVGSVGDLGQELPVISRSVGGLVNPGQILSDRLFQPVSNYFSTDKSPTSQELTAVLDQGQRALWGVLAI